MRWINHPEVFLSNHRERVKKRKKFKSMFKTMAAVLHEIQRGAQLDVRKLLSMEKRSQPAFPLHLNCSQASASSSLAAAATSAESRNPCLTGKHLNAIFSPVFIRNWICVACFIYCKRTCSPPFLKTKGVAGEWQLEESSSLITLKVCSAMQGFWMTCKRKSTDSPQNWNPEKRKRISSCGNAGLQYSRKMDPV